MRPRAINESCGWGGGGGGFDGPAPISWLKASTLLQRSVTHLLNSDILGIPSILGRGLGGKGTLWSSSGGVSGSTGVVVPEVVTPVTIEPLLGVRTIKASSIWWYRLGHRYPKVILDSSIKDGGNDLSVLLLKITPIVNELNSSLVRCNEIAIWNVIKRPSSIWKALVIQKGMGMVNTQLCVIGVGSVDRFFRWFYEAEERGLVVIVLGQVFGSSRQNRCLYPPKSDRRPDRFCLQLWEYVFLPWE